MGSSRHPSSIHFPVQAISGAATGTSPAGIRAKIASADASGKSLPNGVSASERVLLGLLQRTPVSLVATPLP
jgi:hypothetical protein